MQELYVNNYESLGTTTNKVEALSKLESYTNYFYDPSRDGDNDGEVTYGAVSYVVDSEGHALYLIKKSGLPEEIQDMLIGGDAGDGNYADYQSLNDVYGVTSDLKVYYCSSGLSSITGVASSDLDDDDLNRIVNISDNGLKTLLSSYADEDGNFKASSLRSITKLTIDSSVSSLTDLYNLINLKELTIEGVTLSNLNGIQNCTQLYYVFFKSSVVGDYSYLTSLGSKLQYLYFYDISDEELSTVCDGIASAEFSNLNYFAIIGAIPTYITNISSVSGIATYYATSATNIITSLSPLESLSSTTKSAIKYLNLQNNSINGDLSSLSNFTNIIYLRCDKNEITSLNGLDDMDNLAYLQASYNNIGATTEDNTNVAESASTGTSISSLADKSELYKVYLINNSYLANVSYFINDTAIRYFYLAGCDENMAVNYISDIILACGSNYSLPVKFLTGSKYLVSDYYTASTVSYDELYGDLYGNKYITTLDLSYTTLTNEQYQTILSSMTNLQYLSIRYCSNLTTIDFVDDGKVEGLGFLDLYETGVTDLTNLNDYADNLFTLRVNNSEIVLSDIIDTINRIYDNSTTSDYESSKLGFNYNIYAGLYVPSELIKQLENNKNLEKLRWWWSGTDDSISLDLSGCTSLTATSFLGNNNSQIILPVSIKRVTCHGGNYICFSKNTTGPVDLHINNRTITSTETSTWENVDLFSVLYIYSSNTSSSGNFYEFSGDVTVNDFYLLGYSGYDRKSRKHLGLRKHL